jgi:hypothetical protein
MHSKNNIDLKITNNQAERYHQKLNQNIDIKKKLPLKNALNLLKKVEN